MHFKKSHAKIISKYFIYILEKSISNMLLISFRNTSWTRLVKITQRTHYYKEFRALSLQSEKVALKMHETILIT